MKRLLIFIIILLVSAICIGCRTSQNTEGTKQVDYSGELSGVKNSLDSLLATVQMETTELSNKIGKLKVENKTIYYSVPDSSGKQYPVIVSETNADKEDKESTERYDNLTANLSVISNRIDSISRKMDGLLREQHKNIELSWWDLNKDKVYIFILIVIIIGMGYLVYKLKESLSK